MTRLFTKLRLFAFVMLLLTVNNINGNAQTLLTDDVTYSGNLTSNGWSAFSGGGANPIATTTGLSYAGHTGSGIGNAIQVGNTGGEDDSRNLSASQNTNGQVVYYSVLINVNETTSKTGDYFLLLGNGTSNFCARLYARTVGSVVNFGLSNSSAPTYSTTAFTTNTTYLVIVKYTINTGGADPVSFWVLPSGMPATEVAAGTPELSFTTINGVDLINYIGLRQGSNSTSPRVIVDAIRVGTTWSSVVTAGSLPPTVTTDAASLITINSAQLNGTVNANGSSTAVDFEHGLTISYGATVTAAQSPVNGTSATAVSASISSLAPNNEYNYRVTATSANGTSNGSNVSFVTLADLPVAPTASNASSSTIDISINSDNNPAYTQYAIQDTNSGNYVQANGSMGVSAVWQTPATWSVQTINGLTPNTIYVFRVKARNSANVETAFSATAQDTTLANSNPLISITGTLSNFITTAGTPTFSQNYSVSAEFLTANLDITAPADFQITPDTTTTWSSTLSLTPTSGIVAATTIYIRYNPIAAGTTSASITHVSAGSNDPSMSVNGIAYDTEPGTQSSISVSAIAHNSANVQLSGGTGSSRLVIASTASVTYVPVDGNDVAGSNSNFSLAPDLGSNNRPVFNGSGNSFTLTGLTPNTQYYLASYEYNGTSSTVNYLTVNPGSADFVTVVAPPTNVATPVVRMKLDTLYLTFAGGNGTSRLVVMNEGGAVSFVPASGQSYTGVNNDFSLATDQGSGNKIVFDGSGTTVTVTGVQRNTLYGIKVIEYNGSGATSSYFITANGATSATTADYQPYVSGTYAQDFNSLPTTPAALTTTGFGVGPYYLIGPPVNASAARGWQYAKLSGSGSDVVFRTDIGAANNSAIYSYATTGASTERALGFLAGGAHVGTAGITFVNNSATALYQVSLSYDGEHYRNGGNSGTPNLLRVQYRLDSDSLLGVLWTDVPDLTYTVSSGAAAGAVDGNANVTPISAVFTLPSSWLPGQRLTIRFIDADESGSDNGLALDNFSFSALPASAPTEQDSMISFTSVMTTSMTANWLNGNGAGRIVVINTSNTFTDPVDGTNPTANSVYSGSGEQVVYNGSGSDVTITNLTVGTIYYVRVFAYNGSGISQVYALQTATDNPASQQTTSATPPTELAILSINNGNPVKVNQPFSITVQARDAFANPQTVNVNTTVIISVAIGSGILTGTVSGVIAAGTHTQTISGLLYDVAEMGVELTASATAGLTLTDAGTGPFEVFDVATLLEFSFPPVNAVTGVVAPVITVNAYRSNFTPDIYYTENITLSMVSGPGVLGGTLTKAAVNGQVNFDDVIFSAPGNYVLTATSGTLTPATNINILVTSPVVMNELAIPQYFGSKQSSSSTTSNTRTPVFACISFSNLIPDSVYSVYAGLALTTEPASIMGAGTMWTGSSFNIGGYSGLFTADASGNSGPVWIAIQPSGNATRFGAGDVHTIRIAITTSSFGTTVPPAQFSTVNTLTALDIPTTAYDANPANDGAFVTGTTDTCFGGKMALAYSNDAGTGQPLSISGIVSAFATNTSQSDLPSAVNAAFANTAATGTFAFVIPTGINNPSGLRYIGIRNSANQLLNSVADVDGDWTSGNTTTITRRQVITLSNSEVSMNTLTSFSVTSTNVTCFGGNDGSATAIASSLLPPIAYTWTPSGGNADVATNLNAGTYTVLAVDQNGCARSASATITEPAQFPITVGNDGPDCIGDSIQLTATGGVSYSWTGPNGFASTDQNPLLINVDVINSGIYTVIISDASGCTQSATTTVLVYNCNCTPATLTASITNACDGSSNGNIDLHLTGGVAPFTFLWSNGATTEDVSGLTPGTYLVTVTDSVSCIAQQSFNVGSILAPTITPAGPTTFCAGGSVVLSSTAGDSYLWSTGETTSAITVSSSGSYEVTVTIGSCVLTSVSATVTVNDFGLSGVFYSENLGTATGTNTIATYTGWQNGPPVTYASTSASPADLRSTNASTGYTGASGITNVFFTNNGDRNFVISGINTAGYSSLVLKFGLKRDGGSVPMTVECSEDGSTWTVVHSETPAGTGWAHITASGTIPATANLRIRFSKPNAGSYRLDDISLSGTVSTATITLTGEDSVCGAGSAVISSNLSSGLLWSNGATTQSITVTATGDYSYTVTDGNGCVSGAGPVSFTVNPEPVGAVSSGTIACNGGSTEVIVSASGGIGPYSGTGTFTVSAGVHSYIITDITGCDDTVAITVNEPTLLEAISTPGTISCNGGTTTVIVSASGGTSPYTGTGSFTVGAGPYAFIVTDAAGCTAETSGTIVEPLPVSITSIDPASGIAGTQVEITGVELGSATHVFFTGDSLLTAVFSVDNGVITATVPTGTITGPITIVTPCDTVVSGNNFVILSSSVTLDLTVFLQGYYSGGSTMTSTLLNQGVSLDATVTDTITVELHDAVSPFATAYSQNAVLHTDGTANVVYPSSVAGGSYYIVINQRNHLQTWSKDPVTFGSQTSYDFSSTPAPRPTGNGNISEGDSGPYNRQ